MSIDYNVNNLSTNQRLQSIYHNINSSDDYYFIRHGIRAILWLKNAGFEYITSCDIWNCLDSMQITPNNPRSMGLIVKLGHKNHLLERTDRFKPSRRKQANQRPVRVWRLLK